MARTDTEAGLHLYAYEKWVVRRGRLVRAVLATEKFESPCCQYVNMIARDGVYSVADDELSAVARTAGCCATLIHAYK
jgi:hypothetical protein